MPGWVGLDELKNELSREDVSYADTPEDDERLQRALDAAVAFVERVRKGQFNFDDDPLSTRPAPTADLKLGTLMLARRFCQRRRSPDGLVQMAGLGASKVTSFDPDIDRLLRIGKHAKARVG